MKKMQDIDLKNKKVLIREDLNVPLDSEGNISSDIRIKSALPTIKLALEKGAAVILMSHLGRPTEGVFSQEASLAPIALRLSELLGQDVTLVADWQNGVSVKPGQVVLLENIRFNVGENDDAPELAKRLASLCDVFVMDAFATAHRAQASTHGVAKYAKIACAGPLLHGELDAFAKAMRAPAHPLIAIVGGSKVSTKLEVLKNLLAKVDLLIVGGGIANTFIAASGYNVGKSLYEPDLIPEADELIELAKARGAQIPIPTDVIVTGDAVSPKAEAIIKPIFDVEDHERILDIGPETAKHYASLLESAKTIVWNGPVGVFELAQFESGTKALAQAIAASKAFTIAGGGDTLAAVDKYHLTDKISYISTGGGAFLELLEGKELPGISVLNEGK
jgi:phosphoglycerate kinase